MSYDRTAVLKADQEYDRALKAAEAAYDAIVKPATEALRQARIAAEEAYDQAIAEANKEITA